MKVIEIKMPGGPEVLTVAERDMPEAGPGEVLIKVFAAGVNRPDVVQREGRYPPPPGASDIPGLEVAGEIVAVGGQVSGLTVGDRVCALVPGGGYAAFCKAPAATTIKLPEGYDYVKAAAIPETFFTVWSNVFDRAKLAPGETLLVHGGSSGIGSVAIQLAKAFGAKVITTVGSDDKAAFCRDLGADTVINYREEDFAEVVNKVTDGAGVNVVLDMVGGDYVPKNIACLAPDGRHVSIAFLRGPAVEMNMLPVMLKRLTLTGSTLRPRDNTFKGAIAEALAAKVWPLLESGKVSPVIDSVFALEDASKAHALMDSSNHKGKIMLEVSHKQ
ncbi:NAD(P)H-quinone oxidoreductase [Kordiimonas gwangyangensis]|uniref:NAD(P)H-quinone oxidoreductase n=1 Tax=Kordiimonas gwangyangensis TaxID=288022 RepID=UPI000378E086|nr:NAD(P)H-quinone oxidoreductase [Kordiimonas gwangyangensis]